MDLPTILRQARQLAGLSQRGLAQAAGVIASTVAGVEAGRRGCSVTVLEALLASCGLDLELAARAVPASRAGAADALVAHLRLSTSQRLYQAVGGTASVRGGPWPDSWLALGKAASRSVVVLEPELALSLWLPDVPVPWPLPIRRRSRAGSEAVAPCLQVVGEPDPSAKGLVPVAIGGLGTVLAPSPAALLLTEAGRGCPALRQAARLLADDPARDEGGRRAPAHRSPDEATELANLMRSLTFAMHLAGELPQPVDSRGWRLEQPVSLRQWLVRQGLPPREGSARRW
ncbi:MAG: helix-turn-helix transcriptional regulator [Mycobacteriales bacterium]